MAYTALPDDLKRLIAAQTGKAEAASLSGVNKSNNKIVKDVWGITHQIAPINALAALSVQFDKRLRLVELTEFSSSGIFLLVVLNYKDSLLINLASPFYTNGAAEMSQALHIDIVTTDEQLIDEYDGRGGELFPFHSRFPLLLPGIVGAVLSRFEAVLKGGKPRFEKEIGRNYLHYEKDKDTPSTIKSTYERIELAVPTLKEYMAAFNKVQLVGGKGSKLGWTKTGFKVGDKQTYTKSSGKTLHVREGDEFVKLAN